MKEENSRYDQDQIALNLADFHCTDVALHILIITGRETFKCGTIKPMAKRNCFYSVPSYNMNCLVRDSSFIQLRT